MKQLYLVFSLILLTFFHNHADARSKKVLSSCDPELCNPTSVVSYHPGNDKSGNALPSDKKSTGLALDVDGDSGDDYVSLGFNGIIILKYDFPIQNLPGNDVLIAESSPSNLSCSVHKPSVAVYASQDGLNWILVRDGCQDLTIDLPASLPWVKYFKIIDISNPNNFTSASADGYHLDGIKALKCPNYATPNKAIYPFVECVKSNSDGSFTATFGYENTNAQYVNLHHGTGTNEVTGSSVAVPEIFSTGKVHNAFQATFTSGSAIWTLKGPDNVVRTAVASPAPTQCLSATIRGGGDICAGGSTPVYVDLEGEGPWTIQYKNGSNVIKTVTADVDENPKRIDVTQASTYTLHKVTDKNGIEASLFGMAQVLQKPIPNAVLTGNGITCDNSVILTVDINCKCIPFTLTYNDGIKDTTVITTDKVYYITGYVGRTYELKSISNFFCDGTVSGKVTVTSGKPTATFASVNNKCIDSGSKEMLAVNLTGVAPWTVTYSNGSIDKDTTVSSTTFNIPASPGENYTLKQVKDANCTSPASGVVEVNEKPTATISGGGNVCKGQTLLINIAFTGTAPFDFAYSDGTNTITQTAHTSSLFSFNGVAGVTYTLVSLKDKNCEGTVNGTASVQEFATPTALISGGGKVCNGSTLPIGIAFTGEAPFEFSYSDGTNTITKTAYASAVYNFNGDAGKTYTLISFKDNNCEGTVSGSAIVEKFDQPMAVISGGGKVCKGSTAPVRIIMTGEAPFSYSYTDGVLITIKTDCVSNTFTFDGAPGKTYTLLSFKDKNCNGTTYGSAVIEEHLLPTASISGGGKVCKSSTSAVQISLTGTAPFTFSYTDGSSTITKAGYAANSYSFNGQAGKTYSLISINDKNCTNTATGAVSIEEIEAPTASITGSKSICSPNEISDVTISFTGTAPFTYTYSDGKAQFERTSSEYSVTIPVTGTGKYQLVAVKDVICTGTVSGKAEITMPGATASFALNSEYCFGEEILLSPVFQGAPVTAFEFTTNGKGIIVNSSGQTRYIPGEGETGELTFKLSGTDVCGNDFPAVNQKTKIRPKVDASFSYSPSEVFEGTVVTFEMENQEATSQYWLVGKSETSTDRSFEHIFTSPGKYKVVLAALENDCYGFDTLEVDVLPATPEVYVPNIFRLSSTNTENKVIKVYGERISNENFKFKIFNKWGNLLYEVSSFDEANGFGWDGKASGTGEVQPLGVYTYSLDGQFTTGKKFHKTGTVTLIK